jgi:hypothetical protein
MLVSVMRLLDVLDPPFNDHDDDDSNDNEQDVSSSTAAAPLKDQKFSPRLRCTHLKLTSQLKQARYPQFNTSEDNTQSTSSSSSSGNNNSGVSSSLGDIHLVFLGHDQGFDTHNASSGLYCINWSELLLSADPSSLWDPQHSTSLGGGASSSVGPSVSSPPSSPVAGGAVRELKTEKYLHAVIEPGAPTMANSNAVLINK